PLAAVDHGRRIVHRRRRPRRAARPARADSGARRAAGSEEPRAGHRAGGGQGHHRKLRRAADLGRFGTGRRGVQDSVCDLRVS
nr:hypothetical protein [Tanacetum cinerariifolium]